VLLRWRGTAQPGEQHAQRFDADPAAGLRQGRRRRRRVAQTRGVGQLPPDTAISDPGEQGQAEDEQNRHPGRQATDPLLHPPSLDEDLIDQTSRDMLGQYAEP